MPPLCETILGLKVEAVQGKQGSLECTETSGGLWEFDTTLEFLSPFLWERLLFDATGTPGILSRPLGERIPPLDLGGGNGAPLDMGGTLVLPLEWSRECCRTSCVAARV